MWVWGGPMHGEHNLLGAEYLRSATTLLQRLRQEHPTDGVWEAADLQWWWRTPRSTDSWPQPFWFDEGGEPMASAIATDWGGRLGLDIIVLGEVRDELLEIVWHRGLSLVTGASPASIEVMVDDNDLVIARLLTKAGFVPLEDKGASAWMSAEDMPSVSDVPDGYTLTTRADTVDNPHHFVARSGTNVAERLMECSLYRRNLDLSMLDMSGHVAAYGLFWLDPTTRVGFVEPMGTNEGHRRKGLARYLLATGIDRLVDAGATRIKVNYESGNDASSNLYASSGFVPTMATSLWIRNESGPHWQQANTRGVP